MGRERRGPRALKTTYVEVVARHPQVVLRQREQRRDAAGPLRAERKGRLEGMGGWARRWERGEGWGWPAGRRGSEGTRRLAGLSAGWKRSTWPCGRDERAERERAIATEGCPDRPPRPRLGQGTVSAEDTLDQLPTVWMNIMMSHCTSFGSSALICRARWARSRAGAGVREGGTSGCGVHDDDAG